MPLGCNLLFDFRVEDLWGWVAAKVVVGVSGSVGLETYQLLRTQTGSKSSKRVRMSFVGLVLYEAGEQRHVFRMGCYDTCAVC